MNYLSLLALILIGVVFPGIAQRTFGSSDPYCYGKTLESAVSPARKSTYVFMEKCVLQETRFNQSTTILWRGIGMYEPATGRTTENIVVLAQRPDEPVRAYGRFQAMMRCPADPWLTTTSTCNDIVATGDGPLHRMGEVNSIGWMPSSRLGARVAGKINFYSRPYSAILNDGDGKALNVQYPERYSQVQYKRNPNMLQSTAPIIESPQPNARVTSSSFKIQIVPSKNLSGTHILVQFTKDDGPPNQLKPTYAWRRLTSELRDGAYLPTDIVATKGRWTLRARIDAPQLGDFSDDVPFIYEPAIAIKPRKGVGM